MYGVKFYKTASGKYKWAITENKTKALARSAKGLSCAENKKL